MALTHLACFLALSSITVAKATIYRSIVWSPDNPIFKELKPRCVVPKSMQYLLCPSLSLIVTDRDKPLDKVSLYENIWLVDHQSFETCKLNKDARLLKKCTTPLKTSRFDLLFINMHPLSGGLEFKFGKSYYFIATSNGTETSLDNRDGGHCSSHGMKLQFYICKDQQDPYCQSEENCHHLMHAPSTNLFPTTPSSYQSTNTSKYMVTPTSNNTPCSIRYTASSDAFYHVGIAILSLLCVVFISSTVYLAIRFYRFTKLHTDCKNEKVYMTESGDSNNLICAPHDEKA